MYVEVYIDVIFIINFIMDILLLLIIKRILKCSGKKWRLFSGAAFGAAGACIMAVVPNLNGAIQFFLSYIVICFGMITISFRLKTWGLRLKTLGMLYITTFFLGGFLNALYYNTRLGYYFLELMEGRVFGNRNKTYFILAIITGSVAIWIFIKILKNLRRVDLQLYEMELSYGEKTVKIRGLLDTGNNLYDPIYKKPVIIAQLSALNPLFTKNQMNQLQMVFNTLDGRGVQDNKQSLKEQCPFPEEEGPLPMMMIPYHSIGKKNGLLPAVIMNKVVIKSEEDRVVNEKVCTAISRDNLSVQEKYQVILHRDIM